MPDGIDFSLIACGKDTFKRRHPSGDGWVVYTKDGGMPVWCKTDGATISLTAEQSVEVLKAAYPSSVSRPS